MSCLKIYQLSTNKRWHWQVVAPNGRMLGSSASPGFGSKAAATSNAWALHKGLSEAIDKGELA